MKLIIATFNIQNKYKIKDYSGIDSYGDHVIELVNFINDNNIDIIGIQELTSNYKKRLVKLINKKYKIVGKYRFTCLGNLIPIIKKYNETNSIITNKEILSTRTIHLPFFPRLPRIVTTINLKIKNKEIRVINTHLEHREKTIRSKQLMRIIKLLKKNNKDTILMGDFNAVVEDIEFKKFMEELKNLNYKRIDINIPTHRIRNHPIDHIFIPNKWEINNINIPKLNKKISDHKPIIVEVTI